MKEKKQGLTTEEYEKMLNLFIDAVSEEEVEKEIIRKEINKYGFIAFQEYYYCFAPLKQETKDNIYAIKALANEMMERNHENS